MKPLRHIHLFFLAGSLLVGQDTTINSFQYSTILETPNLSFIKHVYSGLDILEQMDFKPIEGKSIALFTNQTAVNRNGIHILDLLKDAPNVKVVALLASENGIWGIDDSRAKLIGRDQVDTVHGAPIIDMFGKYVHPPHWIMDKVDLVVVDFQDTGSRYSTLIATMSKLFESASKWRIPVMILDRPNPIRGDIVNGPIPRTEFQSYESYHLFPIRHGLTLGEISILINEMGWIKDLNRVDLSVVPMSNWRRNMWFDQTELAWRNPTPFLQNETSLLAYTGMDLFRGTNMNIGFGTKTPYLIVGSPWLGSSFLLQKLNDQGLKGVEFKSVTYRPSGSIYFSRVPQYEGQSCSGIQLEITDRNEFSPLVTATTLILMIHQLHPREFQWKSDGYIDKLFGSDLLRLLAAQKKPPDHLPAQWVHDVYKFNEFRQPFLLYK
ncbi:MAG: DUF1343 domain-containing protein [Candidatus Marinimicrobia bacterium]|nr:DUF1343 domain-containing protein [Candidatus Neomarinimicrobiota bacterium]MBT4554129.1 DUF1343 domain-containing protein [Candidatus Neomarinimicrobiota bacterium]MBT4753620.1 DUF1343 domain-containing protein [Candidatus Neomarinimicrobiota bacterium]